MGYSPLWLSIRYFCNVGERPSDLYWPILFKNVLKYILKKKVNGFWCKCSRQFKSYITQSQYGLTWLVVLTAYLESKDTAITGNWGLRLLCAHSSGCYPHFRCCITLLKGAGEWEAAPLNTKLWGKFRSGSDRFHGGLRSIFSF